jgi:putative SOS response-associated peptidase YedK
MALSDGVSEIQAFFMCREYEQQISYAEYCEVMQDLALGVPTHQTELDMPADNDIKIGQIAPVIRAAGDNILELTQMKFGFPPTRTRGPIFNLRSQGKHFGDSHRCLVPATAFFEYSGRKYPRAKHRFTLVSARLMAIAAIWRPSRKGEPAAFTMLTTAPGPDVQSVHNRQVVVLPPISWKAWIDLTEPVDELLCPLPAGSLRVETRR